MAILKGNNLKNILDGGIDNDVIFGYGDNDILNGGSGDDTLLGGVGNDILIAGIGDDTLNGGSGADELIGGDGGDIYIVDNLGDVIFEAASGGFDTVHSSLSWTLGENLEKLFLTGPAINGTGNALNNTIKGNNANNLLVGGDGNDVLIGGLGIDTLFGGTGNDSLKISNFLADVIDGGTGTDNLQIVADNQILNLSTTDSIKNIEVVRLGDSHSTLIVDAQSVIALSSDSNTLKVDASGASNTLKMESGWLDKGVANGYRTFTQGDAALLVNTAITNIEVIGEPTAYTISDTNTAAQVSTVFDSGVQEITLDFGGKNYNGFGLDSIDLSGFGLEDKLIVTRQDGSIRADTPRYNTADDLRYIYIAEAVGRSSWILDRVSWQAGANTAHLISSSAYRYTYPSSTTYSSFYTYISTQLGDVQITGLPTGLADSQFVFV